MKKTYKKYFVIFTLILSVFICTACSDDKKESSSDLSNLVDELTAVNYGKYVDESKKAQDKMTYDNITIMIVILL